MLSILLATLTVFPQISYWGFLAPITPATTGPMFKPASRNQTMRQSHFKTVDSNKPFHLGLANLHLEIVEGVLVDVFHLLPQPHGIVRQSQDV